jgi:predicted nucleic acid-binding protein
MQSYVADVSVIVQHVVTDTYTANVDALFDQLGETLVLVVPEFALLECGNVLWKRVRFHRLPSDEAATLLSDLIALPFTIIPSATVLSRALQIGLAHSLAVYDSVYIALAEQLHFPLLTTDTRQQIAAEQTGVVIKPITDFAAS